MPFTYIDPQIVAETGLVNAMTLVEIEKATVYLDYLEGYPVVNGLPFWERLDGEFLQFYRLFQCYRNMQEQEGKRSLDEVAKRANLNMSIINSLSRAYHWRSRAKAYDIYREQQLEMIKNNNIKKMENKHQAFASEMFDLCRVAVKDLLDSMKRNPGITKVFQEELRKWFEMAVSLERLSLGMPKDKPSDAEYSEAINTVVNNYAVGDIKHTNIQNRSTNVNVGKLQEVVNILSKSGVFTLEKDNGNGNGNGNGHKQVPDMIDVGEEESDGSDIS